LDYSYKEEWTDIISSLVSSLVMGVIVYNIQLMYLLVWLALIIQVCVGMILYVVVTHLFKLECFTYLLSKCKDIFENRKGAIE